ncbi:MAG: GNAT family N-acetyltransferase [Dehalococcoidia bacterium]|nr:GNAT family N-acetyltransferase [Dehalococcoidia bacterium]
MPNVEIRPATAEEMPTVAREASRQLGNDPAMFAGLSPDWTMCALVDGQVVTTYGFWPLQVRFNGPAVPVDGVTWVSTHPAHRRKGYLRAVTRKHFEMIHERKHVAIAALHPAWMSIYQRYGYGSITQRTSYAIEPAQVQFHHPLEARGSVREVDMETEFGLLVDVYRRYREERNGLVHRGRAMWDAGPASAPPKDHRQVILAYEEDGDPLGYVIYHHGAGYERDSVGAGQYLRITDLVALTPEAIQALWRVVGGYDNVAQIRWDNAPVDDPLVLMLAEPRMLNRKIRDGIMARLVNVDDALAQRPYPVASELTFDLVDAFCEWNAGRWALTTDPEGAEARRIDGQGVDLRLTPDTLASLAFGRYSASEAHRAGLLEDIRDASVLERWDAVLRTKYPPHEAEHTW